MRISHQNSKTFYSDLLRSWSRSAPPRRMWLHLQGPLWSLPWIPICADPLIPSFQLSIQPALKALTDHSLGHKMVHVGCCQDPNIYCLYPIVESWAVSTNLNSNSLGSFFFFFFRHKALREARPRKSHVMICHDSHSKLESRLLGEVSITSDVQMTPPLWQKASRS